MTLENIAYIAPIIKKYSQSTLPIKTTYKLLKLSKFVQSEMDNYQKILDTIIEKYADKDENGDVIRLENGNFQIAEEAVDKANKELQDLVSVEIEIPDIKFDLNELESIELTPVELDVLMNFINE